MIRPLHQPANIGSPERGGALAASLALVVLIASMGAGLVQVVSSTTRRQAMGFDSMRALYVAEAGLAEGYLSLAQGRTGEVGSPSELAAYGGGLFWVTSEDLPDGMVRLVSNGLFGRGRSTLSVVAEKSANPVGSLGLSSLGQIEVGAGTSITAVDSSVPGSAVPNGARVRSNGDILLHSIAAAPAGSLPGESTGPVDDEFPDSKYAGPGMTTVLGDARPGVEGTVQYDAGSVISGSTAPSVQPITTPAVKIPRGAALNGDLNVAGRQSLTGEHRLQSLAVQSGSELTLTGPLVLVVGDLTALKEAEVTIDSTAGPVEIFVKGRVDFQTRSKLTNVGSDPTQVALIVGAPPRGGDGRLPVKEQRILSSGDFEGLIYAPYSQLKIGGGLHVTGAASAGQLHLGPGAKVSYDIALKSAGVGVPLTPRQVAWTVEPLTDDPLMRSTADAETIATVLGRTSVRSSDAHATYDAEIEYVDLLGDVQTYAGDVRGMIWADVQDVSAIAWEDTTLGTYGPQQKPPVVVNPDAVPEPDTQEIAETLATPL